MTLTFTLSEDDLVTHQLYAASISNSIKKKRTVSHLLSSGLFTILACWYYALGNTETALGCILGALIIFAFLPVIQKHSLKKQVTSLIRETQKDRIGATVNLELNKDYFINKRNGNEFKMPTSAISFITEIPSLIIIRSSSESLLIPKNGAIDLSQARAFLQSLAGELNIPYRLEDQWKW